MLPIQFLNPQMRMWWCSYDFKYNSSALLLVPELCLSCWRPCSAGRREEAAGILIFHLFNWFFTELFWPASMTVKGCCLPVHHDNPPLPTSYLQPTIHPWHSHIPTTLPCSKQTNVWWRSKKKSLFFSQSNIYIFEGRPHCQPGMQDERTRKCPWAVCVVWFSTN